MESTRNREWNIARIHGWTRTSCGYCGGERAFVLNHKNPAPSSTKADGSITTKITSSSDDKIETELSCSPALVGDKTNNCTSNEQKKHEYVDEEQKYTSSKAYGTTFSRISTSDYQLLIDSGWRRSGKHLYKPDNWNSCCPTIPIRLDTAKFKPTKGQRKVWRVLNNTINAHGVAVANDLDAEMADHSTNQHKHKKKKLYQSLNDKDKGNTSDVQSDWMKNIEISLRKSGILKKLEQVTFDLLKHDQQDESWNLQIEKLWCQFKLHKSYFPNKKVLEKIPTQTTQDRKIELECCIFSTACAAIAGRSKGKLSPDTLGTNLARKLLCMQEIMGENEFATISSIECHKKSGQIKVFLKVNVYIQNHESIPPNQTEKSANEGFSSEIASTKDPTTKKPLPSHSSSFHDEERIKADDCLAQILKSNPRASNGSDRSSNKSLFTVKSVPSHISGQDPEVIRLYFKYQQLIHGDENPFQEDSSNDDSMIISSPPSKSGHTKTKSKHGSMFTSFQKKKIKHFTRFLCDSPLPIEDGNFTMDADGYDTLVPYGSYHQQYRLNNQLVAVGVVDILPHCLSSVYSFYDPILSKKLQLGTLTALREIEWVKRASFSRPQLKYYYLGFYIHSCSKMRYKAEFKPSMLLCPTYGKWVDFETAKSVLNRDCPLRHCCSLASPEIVSSSSSSSPLSSSPDSKKKKHISSFFGSSLGSKNVEPNLSSVSSSSKRFIRKAFPRAFLKDMHLDIGQRQSNGSSDTKDCDMESDNEDGYDYKDDEISEVEDEGDEEESINDVIDLDNLITVGDLSSYGRKLVDSHILEFMTTIGEKVCHRCIIKL